jgi:hypothetical protein
LDLTKILKTNRGTSIKKLDFLGRLKDVVKDIGIEENIKTHSFRKYFSSQVRIKCKIKNEKIYTNFNKKAQDLS